ncbi:hypothetical protein ADK60_16550 [Streptomyces sp. XY431]|uniref:peptidoglycan-binding domain-containing protein n=1 Tax=Streptomyces sp. XY431 TaxID=1415562 RepID=UPI0006AEFB54|nr:peptidoglycan-binding domain-containing protein [Streptomyces sp. XY431]KOV30539.1 hypothetical protein ADK60_16550 [Streptomyces sp. XY431]
MKLHGRIAACAIAGAAALAGFTATAPGASATSATTAPTVVAPRLASVAVLAESACPYSGAHPNLYYTDTGPAVTHAQCLINIYGYGIAEDGIYGATTRDVVRTLQRRCAIPVDGVVGPKTWDCLHPDKSPNPR